MLSGALVDKSTAALRAPETSFYLGLAKSVPFGSSSVYCSYCFTVIVFWRSTQGGSGTRYIHVLSVALNCGLYCPDLWDIFISSANGCLEQCHMGGLCSAGSKNSPLLIPHSLLWPWKAAVQPKHGNFSN